MAPARLFDHDEARRRVRAGESINSVAAHFGVSYTAIWRIQTPERVAADQARTKAFYRATCEACGGPCLSIRYTAKRNHSPDGRELCARCRSDEKIERLRFDLVTNELIAVRCCSRDCANGERWQDPDNFTRGRPHQGIREGGIHGNCRACATRARRRYRHEHVEATRAYYREYRRRKRAAA